MSDFSNKERHSAVNTVRSFTRLVVGGALLGWSELTRRLPFWEEEAAILYPERMSPEIPLTDRAEPRPKTIRIYVNQKPRQSAASENDAPDKTDEPNTKLPAPQPPRSAIIAQPNAPRHPETLFDLARYATIGLLFKSQIYVRQGMSAVGHAGQTAGKIARPVLKPLSAAPIPSFVRIRVRRVISRGKAEIARWIELGRAEEPRSQALAQVALDDTLDIALGIMAENPEVRDLVMQQSSGLAGEVVDEMRERAVSADTLVEAVIHRLFRRPLPDPTTQRIELPRKHHRS